MAYLTLAGSDEAQSTCFKFIGSNSNVAKGGLISSNTSLISVNVANDDCLDTCSFYNGPTDSQVVAFCEGSETMGSIAYAGETCGSIAYAGETCGSIASSVSTGSSFSGGGCSYTC